MPNPIPANEFERLINLSEFDIDYGKVQEPFNDLTKLAAKVAGTEISLINLIDTFTQWTVSNYGLDVDQMSREDSVCQYTIVGTDSYEVKDLYEDLRFRYKDYVSGPNKLRYYFGLPLATKEGFNVGALCVMDRATKEITPEKVELLKIIADEIVNRLYTLKAIEQLKKKLTEIDVANKKVAHDIRGPLGGIIGLAEIIAQQGKYNKIEEVLEFIGLILKSGRSILDLADEILSSDKRGLVGEKAVSKNDFNLSVFKERIEKLYLPQAKTKQITLNIDINEGNKLLPIPKNKLLQITGNLVSNAIKFTPKDGKVNVSLNIDPKKELLTIEVSDTGTGMGQEQIKNILDGNSVSSNGTSGETGYGFGLSLVRHLIHTLKGEMLIESSLNAGTKIRVLLPQDKKQ